MYISKCSGMDHTVLPANTPCLSVYCDCTKKADAYFDTSDTLTSGENVPLIPLHFFCVKVLAIPTAISQEYKPSHRVLA